MIKMSSDEESKEGSFENNKKERSSDEDSENEEDEYVVERVVDVRKNKKGKKEYLLKWKGWPE